MILLINHYQFSIHHYHLENALFRSPVGLRGGRHRRPAEVDVEVGEGLLQALRACFGRLRLPEVEGTQRRQFGEVLKAGIADVGAVEIQVFEELQPLEVGQSGVGDGGLFEVQAGQVRQAGEGSQGRIVYLRAA